MVEPPDWFWGVDVSTKAVSLGVYGGPSGTFWQTATRHPKTPWPQYLRELAGLTRELGEALIPELEPTVIAVEQPIGRHPSPHLMAAWGAVIATVNGACPGTLLLTPKPNEWRKVLNIPTNAAKEELVRRARNFGCESPDHNEAEACLIAVACSVRYGQREAPRRPAGRSRA